MKFVKPILVLALTVFVFSPSLADEGKNTSYRLKKQGRVHFQDKAQERAAADVQDVSQDIHPANIEPAAGGFDVEEKKARTSLSKRIRLPRKN